MNGLKLAAGRTPRPFLGHWCPPQIQGRRPLREDIQMIILKIATIGILVALLSTGLGSDLALAVIAII